MSASAARRGLSLAALGLGLAAALLIGELTLRWLRPPQLAIVRYPCIYRPDPVTGFRYAPHASGLVAAHFEIENRVETNALGFYDAEPGPADASPRVLALGDSFTAAMNVPKPEIWTSVLERALREAGRTRADVVNLGLDGTGTDVQAALLPTYLERFAPEIVVLAFFGNDVMDVVRGRFERECHEGYVLSYQTPSQRDALRARVDAHRAKRLRRWLHEKSFFARLVAAAVIDRSSPYRVEFQQPRLAELDPAARDQGAGLRRFRAAVRRLEALAAACDCRLVVAPVPPRSEPGGSLRVWRRQAADSSLEVIDLLPRIEALRRARGVAHEALYFEHDNHFNGLGNELYGRALAEALLAGPPPPS